MVQFRAKLGEKEYPIEVSTDAKIIEAKMQLEKSSGGELQASQQKWIYQGRILSDDATVASTGILDGHAVHVLKTASAAAPASTAPAAAPASAAPAAAPAAAVTAPVPAASLRPFDQGMEKLLTNSEDIVYNAVSLLSKILNNIISHPMEEKYRKIKTTNAAFSAKVHTVRGGADCMRAAGFVEVSGEWILHPSAEGWNLLVACKNKLDLFYGRLNAQRAMGGGSTASPPPVLPAAAAAQPVDPNAVLAILAALQCSPSNGGGADSGGPS